MLAAVDGMPKTAKKIPSLIPIHDSRLFKRQPATKLTDTAKYISNFLRDFDEQKNRSALESTNITQEVSFDTDESFGRLYYSDSE